VNNYAYPFERPLSRGTFDFCAGPGGRWAAWVASAGIRSGLYTGKVLDDVVGSPNPLFTAGERPTKLSICFDAYSRQVLAIQKTASQIEVRFFQQSNIGPTPFTADMDTITADSDTITADNLTSGSLVTLDAIFAGLSPILFFNGITSLDPFNADVICFYLDAVGDTIYCRFLADNFGVQYQINGGLPVNLVSLLKADLITVGGSQFLALWALTDAGKQVFIRATRYAPEFEERLSIDESVGGGTYVNPPTIPTVTDALTIDIALNGSDYSPTILPTDAPPDALTVDATIASGLYVATVVPNTPSADRLTVTQTIASGSYA
jgi:hypothetical protein